MLPFVLPLRAAAMAEEARGDDARVVEDEQVAGREQRRQVAHDMVAQAVRHLEQARGIARHRRPVGDQLRRQLEIEEIDAHVSSGTPHPTLPLKGGGKKCGAGWASPLEGEGRVGG